MSARLTEMVWSPSLTGPRVTVHAFDWRHPRIDTRTTGVEFYLTPCARTVASVKTGEHGTWLGPMEEHGAHLRATHAEAMGAKFCRRCWPERVTS